MGMRLFAVVLPCIGGAGKGEGGFCTQTPSKSRPSPNLRGLSRLRHCNQTVLLKTALRPLLRRGHLSEAR